jgi:hypothetical protein
MTCGHPSSIHSHSVARPITRWFATAKG